MKRNILALGCLALGLVGCATNQGGTGDPYAQQYGSARADWGAQPVYRGPVDSIYPVREQPAIQGNTSGGVRPMLDPYRQWEAGYYTRHHTAAATGGTGTTIETATPTVTTVTTTPTTTTTTIGPETAVPGPVLVTETNTVRVTLPRDPIFNR
jgi:hypothetical protein